ncbi:MAG: S9 family peptidase [Acidobacteria bacterium]|nr:S9 family peptidase [Acidobacteriota bacterium]
MRIPVARLTLLLLLAHTSLFAQTSPPVTNGPLVEMVTRMARIGRAGSPTFSPDGTKLAFVSDRTGVPQVWVAAADGSAPVQVTKGDDPIGRVTWSPKGDWLALSLAPGGGMNTQLFVVRPDGTGLRRLTDGGKETNNLGDWTDDGRRLTMGSNRANPSAIDVYFADPVSGERVSISENKGLQTVTDVSRDGRLALVSRLRGRGDNDLYVVDLKTRAETLVTPHDPPGSFFGVLAPDGRTIYLSSDKDRDKAAFARVVIDAGGKVSPPQLLASRNDAELGGFELDEKGTTAALLWNVAGRSELWFVDLASGKTSAGPKLPAEIAGGLTFSADGKQLAMTISGATAPPDVWVLDVTSGRLRQVTRTPHEGIDLATLARPELVTFKAHDGLELSGWLYRPAGRPAPAPFVVSFHGGPEGQERPTFRSDYQALVAQGIGVFAPNVRGSSGFGKRFVNLDNGALRFEGIKDLEDSVRYLVDSRLADPKRIGITGGSYGGYMTMVGVTFYPDLFAAAVNLFGMVNFFTFFEHTEPWMAAISTTEYGDPRTQADLLRDLSPLGKLDRIRTPMMVQHGANDTNVPVVEAEQIVDNLKRRGVPVEYVLFPDEGHGFRKEKNRITSTVKLVEFFVTHLVAGQASR